MADVCARALVSRPQGALALSAESYSADLQIMHDACQSYDSRHAAPVTISVSTLYI